MATTTLSLDRAGCALGCSYPDEGGRIAATLSVQALRPDSDLVDKIKKKHRSILLVDDEIGFRKSLKKKLEKLYQASVEDVGGGQSALERVSDDKNFDLILMDVSMPDLSGIETCKLMRSRGVTAYVVLMSARNDPQYRLQAEALGVELLSKPLDEHALRRVLLECGGEESS